MSGFDGADDGRMRLLPQPGDVPEGRPERDALSRTDKRPSGSEGGRTLLVGLVSCLIGGAFAGLLPALGCVFVGYGVVLATSGRSATALLGTLAASLAAAAGVCLLTSPASLLGAGVAVLSAFACAAAFARERLSVSAGLLIVAACALALIGTGVLYLSGSGTSVQELIRQTTDQLFKQAATSSVDFVVAVKTLSEFYQRYWPSAFLLVAIAYFGLAYLGAYIAAPKASPAPRRPDFRLYDVPLWVVGVLVVVLLALSVNAAYPVMDGVVRMVCDNLLVALRLALMLQGLAVIAWLLKSRNAGPWTAAFTYAAAVFLESELYFMAIFGFVDVWANFRHLPRGGTADVREDGGQANGSA